MTLMGFWLYLLVLDRRAGACRVGREGLGFGDSRFGPLVSFLPRGLYATPRSSAHCRRAAWPLHTRWMVVAALTQSRSLATRWRSFRIVNLRCCAF